MEHAILVPVLALITWTLVIWFWMYAQRIPAMQKAQIDPQDAAHPGSLNMLPARVRQAADNYNHLHEQPTIFYALMFYCALAGTGDDLNVTLAWAYVGLRVVHSLVQVSINKVALRFSLFALASLMLVAITMRNLQVLVAG